MSTTNPKFFRTQQEMAQQIIPVVDTWDEAVYWEEGDRYFYNLEDAFDYFDCEDIDSPEHLQCCKYEDVSVDRDLILNYLEDNFQSGEGCISEFITEIEKKMLDVLLARWCRDISYKMFKPIKQRVSLRSM